MARDVLSRDDTADRLKSEIMDDMIETAMAAHPVMLRSHLEVILIARNLERIADHATDIC